MPAMAEHFTAYISVSYGEVSIIHTGHQNPAGSYLGFLSHHITIECSPGGIITAIERKTANPVLLDHDRDGWQSEEDCDETDATISPGAEEIWYDSIDQNCDKANDFDADGDGHESAEYAGKDCDDFDASVYPGAVEDPDTEKDENCDGRE